MDINDLIQKLESEWDIDGGFYQIRNGHFDSSIATRILEILDSTTIDELKCIPRRLVSLLWFIPTFLQWNAERVASVSKLSNDEYELFTNKVVDRLSVILGVP